MKSDYWSLGTFHGRFLLYTFYHIIASGGFTKNSISYASGSKLRLVLVTMHHDDGFIKEFRMNAPAKEQLSGISCAVERTADQVACLRLTYRSRLLGE